MINIVNHGQQRSIMGLKIFLVIAANDSSESSDEDDEDLKKSD
jgi:hypothetical protein